MTSRVGLESNGEQIVGNSLQERMEKLMAKQRLTSLTSDKLWIMNSKSQLRIAQ